MSKLLLSLSTFIVGILCGYFFHGSKTEVEKDNNKIKPKTYNVYKFANIGLNIEPAIGAKTGNGYTIVSRNDSVISNISIKAFDIVGVKEKPHIKYQYIKYSTFDSLIISDEKFNSFNNISDSLFIDFNKEVFVSTFHGDCFPISNVPNILGWYFVKGIAYIPISDTNKFVDLRFVIPLKVE